MVVRPEVIDVAVTVRVWLSVVVPTSTVSVDVSVSTLTEVWLDVRVEVTVVTGGSPM
jgi:hypothetical protein